MKYDCSKCESSFECKMTLACREENDNLDTIFWHPYPQEMPKSNGRYLVSVSNHLDGKGPVHTDIITFIASEKRWYFRDYGIPERTVVAWAEIPKPYKED